MDHVGLCLQSQLQSAWRLDSHIAWVNSPAGSRADLWQAAGVRGDVVVACPQIREWIEVEGGPSFPAKSC